MSKKTKTTKELTEEFEKLADSKNPTKTENQNPETTVLDEIILETATEEPEPEPEPEPEETPLQSKPDENSPEDLEEGATIDFNNDEAPTPQEPEKKKRRQSTRKQKAAPEPEPEPTTDEQEPTEGTTLLTAFPNGSAITVLDSALKVLFPLGLNALLGTKLKKEQFELTSQEKRALKQPVDECLKTIPINFNNPWVNLSIVLGTIYMSKALEVVDFSKLGKK
jgi:hypothetical protein